MSNLFVRLHPNQEATEVANANVFFKENNIDGYKTKEDFKDFVNRLQANDLEKFELLFNYMGKNFPINQVVRMKYDHQTGEMVTWLKFQLPNALQNIRIVCDEDILRLIQDYQLGDFQNGYSLEELLIEAGFDLNTEA